MKKPVFKQALVFILLIFPIFLWSQGDERLVPSELDGRLTAQTAPLSSAEGGPSNQAGYLINFNNLRVIEVLRFISRISGKNFIFNEEELGFLVTIVSEEPASVDDIMAALMQVLRINGMTMLEQGNNVVIHKNRDVLRMPRLVGDEFDDQTKPQETEMITRVYRLTNITPEKVSTLIKTMISKAALVETLPDTRQLIVTDFASNIERITKLIDNLDTAKIGSEIGQYLVRNKQVGSLLDITEKVLRPIAGSTPMELFAHGPTNSIFVVSTPYLVERALAVMQTLDSTGRQTRIMNLDKLDVLIQNQDGGFDITSDKNTVLVTIDSIEEELSRLESPIALTEEELGFDPSIPDSKLSPEQLRWKRDLYNRRLREREELRRRLQAQLADLRKQAIRAETRGPAGDVDEDLVKDISVDEYSTPTKFFIYKLQNRTADTLRDALRDVGQSLGEADPTKKELVDAIKSIEDITESNSLIVTGTERALKKVQDLIRQLDTPLRQVFIEVLIIETSIENSLNFGVQWGAQINNGSDVAGGFGFLPSGSPIPTAQTDFAAGTPDSGTLLGATGFSIGAIGKVLTHGGNAYTSLAGILNAIQGESETRVIMNPKIIAEDNSSAELFVGINTRFRTTAISNADGNIITENFEFRDVGARLSVTPFLGDGDNITLEVDQELSSISGDTEGNNTTDLGPTTSIVSTQTRVHVPNGHFLVLSGLIRNDESKSRTAVPCLGGMPVVGAAFSDNASSKGRANLMIFMRPIIVDTPEEIRRLTKNQHRFLDSRDTQTDQERFKYEIETGLEFLNLKDDNEY